MTSNLDVWDCRQCGDMMTNLTQRCQKRETCDYCTKENRKLRARMNHFIRRVQNAKKK